MTVLGVPATSLARTVVDVARRHPLRTGLVVADAALRRGMEPAAAAEVLSRSSRRPGARRAAEALRLGDGRAENPLESLGRWAVHELGLPVFEPQVEVRDEHGRFLARVDGAWKEERTVLELDGRGKYDRPGALIEEKQREDLLRDYGLQVGRRLGGRLDATARVRRPGASRVRAGGSRLRPAPRHLGLHPSQRHPRVSGCGSALAR